MIMAIMIMTSFFITDSYPLFSNGYPSGNVTMQIGFTKPIPYWNKWCHFSQTRSRNSGVARATGGKVLRRSQGIQASITIRELKA